MAITVKELEDVKLEIIENIETILRVEDVAVSEMDKTEVVKMLIMSAALIGVAIEYASEDEAMRDAAEFEARVAVKLAADNQTLVDIAYCEDTKELIKRGIPFYMLKTARLQVEEEMGVENTGDK